ncbi:MAG: hypothetical protein J1F39_00990 [Clostridiales bacterium]|nr:hypothetical protein [Clostridiales bacterium]
MVEESKADGLMQMEWWLGTEIISTQIPKVITLFRMTMVGQLLMGSQYEYQQTWNPIMNIISRTRSIKHGKEI